MAWIPVVVVCAACLLLPARLRADKAAWIVPGVAAALEDPNLEVRVYALGLVSDLGDPAFTDLAVPHLAAAEPVVRKAAVEALQPIVPLPAEVLEAMARLASDPVPEIRLAALAALKDRPLTPAACALVAGGFKAPDSATRFAALEALAGSARSASGLAPQLAPLLSDPDAEVRREAVVVLDGSGGARQAIPGLVALLEDKAQPQEVRLAVAETFGHLGSEGRAAVPALVQAASDKDEMVRLFSTLALGRLGPVARQEAVEPLALLLPYGGFDPFNRECRERLTELGEDALRKAAELWALRLQDPDRFVRSRALRALAILGKPAEAQSERASMLLRDPEPWIRSEAIDTLLRLKVADRFKPDLERLLLDPDPGVRASAIGALGEVGGSSHFGMAQLLSFLRDFEGRGAVSGAAAAIVRSRRNPSDLEMIAGDLASGHAKSRALAVEILASFGEAARPHETGIAALLRDQDRYVREAARLALLKLETDREERRLARIREWLDGSDAEARRTALVATRDLGASAGPLIPSLERLLRIADPSVKGTVSELLSEIGRAGNAEAVQATASLLRGPDWQIQYHALKTLAVMGRAALPASPSVLEILASERVSLRRAAFETLLAMTGSTWQEPPREGFPDDQARAVALLLRDPDARLRETVRKELLRFGPLAANMAPVFAELLADPDPELRSAGAALLESIGQAAGPWHAPVSALLADPDPGVRAAGLRALTSPGLIDIRDADAVSGLLEDADAGVRSAAATVLGRFGPAAAAQEPRLLPLLQDPEPGVRWSALVGLQGLRSAPGEVLPQIVLRLMDPAPVVAQTANDTLWKLAPLDLHGLAALLELGYEYPSGGSSFRFRAHLFAGGNPDGELLIDWLDALATVPAGLDEPRALALLDGLAATRFAVEPHRHLRSLLAERVSAVAAAVDWSAPEAVPVLRSHLAWLEEQAPDKAASVRAAVEGLEHHGLLSDWFEGPATYAASRGEILLDGALTDDLRIEAASGRLRVRGSRSSAERLMDGLVDVVVEGRQWFFMKKNGDLFHLRDDLVSGNYALLIGISHYQGNLEPLPSALEQTRKLGAILQANGFNVTYLLDDRTPVTLKVIERAVAELNRKIKHQPYARLFFYFGGHGKTVSPPFGEPITYLVVNGCNLASPEDGCLSMNDIYEGRFSRYIVARQVLFAIDACVAAHGRRGGPEDSKETMDLSLLQILTEPKGRSVFTASSGDGSAFEDRTGGIFTTALIDAFRGEADRLFGDRNGIMTLGELYSYVKSRVNLMARRMNLKEEEIQSPRLESSGDGQFVFFQTAGRRRAP